MILFTVICIFDCDVSKIKLLKLRILEEIKDRWCRVAWRWRINSPIGSDTKHVFGSVRGKANPSIQKCIRADYGMRIYYLDREHYNSWCVKGLFELKISRKISNMWKKHTSIFPFYLFVQLKNNILTPNIK